MKSLYVNVFPTHMVMVTYPNSQSGIHTCVCVCVCVSFLRYGATYYGECPEYLQFNGRVNAEV